MYIKKNLATVWILIVIIETCWKNGKNPEKKSLDCFGVISNYNNCENGWQINLIIRINLGHSVHKIYSLPLSYKCSSP